MSKEAMKKAWFEYKETDLYGGKSVNSFEAGWKAALTALKDKLTNDNNIDNNTWNTIILHINELK